MAQRRRAHPGPDRRAWTCSLPHGCTFHGPGKGAKNPSDRAKVPAGQDGRVEGRCSARLLKAEPTAIDLAQIRRNHREEPARRRTVIVDAALRRPALVLHEERTCEENLAACAATIALASASAGQRRAVVLRQQGPDDGAADFAT